MLNLCVPALIYLVFSLTQITIDTLKGLYNIAFLKIIVMLVITILLNTLCQSGMGIISWLIVFILFIFMSVVVTILLYIFGLDPETGELIIKCNNCSNAKKSGNLIYRSTKGKPSKHIDVSYSDTPAETEHVVSPFWSSDPQYE